MQERHQLDHPITNCLPLQTPFKANYQRLVEYAVNRYNTTKTIPTEVLNSLIEGRGLYATTDIAPGHIVGVYKGSAYAENFKNNPIVKNYSFQIKTPHHTLYISPSQTELDNPAHDNAFMANDGTPNSSFFSLGAKYLLISIKNIKKGEEILFDYGHDHPTKNNPQNFVLSKDPQVIAELITKTIEAEQPEFYDQFDQDMDLLKNDPDLPIDQVIQYFGELTLSMHIAYLVTHRHPLYVFLVKTRHTYPEWANDPEKLATLYLDPNRHCEEQRDAAIP
jgi:hypothetical protein